MTQFTELTYLSALGLGVCEASFAFVFLIALTVVLSRPSSPFLSAPGPLWSWIVLNIAAFSGIIMDVLGLTGISVSQQAAYKTQWSLFLLELFLSASLAVLRVQVLYGVGVVAIIPVYCGVFGYFALVCATIFLKVSIGSSESGLYMTETTLWICIGVSFVSAGILLRQTWRGIRIASIRCQITRAIAALILSTSLSSGITVYIAIALVHTPRAHTELQTALRFACCVVPLSANLLIAHLAMKCAETHAEAYDLDSNGTLGSIQFGSSSCVTTTCSQASHSVAPC
ncbi:hypothetical protein C8T65DRAFT_640212 [Cerioporus squamosus]|nr:hypothetical protein C8T65DRAFT_640212 [Cerioporus squamosus]